MSAPPKPSSLTFKELYASPDPTLLELQASRPGHLDSVTTKGGQGLVLTAVRKNDHESLEKFLKVGLSLPRNALHLAAGRCHLPSIRTLVQHGADVNARCFQKMTPLDFILDVARWTDKPQCAAAQLLLDSGADVSLVCTSKAHKMMDRPDLLLIFLRAGLDPNSTCQCTFRRLLERALPNHVDKLTPERYQVIQALLNFGASIDDRWYLSFACFNHQPKVVRLLISASPEEIFRHSSDCYDPLQTYPYPCKYPICAAVYATLEYGTECLDTLKVLLSANFPTYWDASDHVDQPLISELCKHESPFDQVTQSGSPFTLSQPAAKLLLESGCPSGYIAPIVAEEVYRELLQYNVQPKSLFKLSVISVRRCLGPSRNFVALVEKLPIPGHLTSDILLYTVLLKS